MEMQETIMSNDVEVIQEFGYYAAYVNGEFYCSGDTFMEVVNELTDDGIL